MRKILNFRGIIMMRKNKRKEVVTEPNDAAAKKKSCGCGCLVFFLIAGAIGSLFGGGDSNDKNTTTQVAEITTELTTTTEEDTETETETVKDTETESETTETTTTEAEVEHRDGMYGVSDKDFDEIGEPHIGEVRDDVTGNWRICTIADNIDIEYYALSYYEKYFTSDSEVHGIVNFTRKTTTCITCIGSMLDVTIHEYVDGEEHSAKDLFGGDVDAEFYIYLDNGDIQELDLESSDDDISDNVLYGESDDTEAAASESTTQVPATTQAPTTEATTQAPTVTEAASNTATVWIPQSGSKYHSSSSCSGMKNPQQVSIDDAISMGYTACKKCY
jgi:hypothetical protein